MGDLGVGGFVRDRSGFEGFSREFAARGAETSSVSSPARRDRIQGDCLSFAVGRATVSATGVLAKQSRSGWYAELVLTAENGLRLQSLFRGSGFRDSRVCFFCLASGLGIQSQVGHKFVGP